MTEQQDRSTRLLAAGISAGAVVVAALIAASAALIPTFLSDAASSQEPPPEPPAEITITSVEARGDHEGVSSRDGLQASGDVANLPKGSTVWLMDKDSSSYTVDQMAKISAGSWSAESHPVGDKTDVVPFAMEVAVILADSECAKSLKAEESQGDSVMETLPPGCQEMDTREVRVTER